MRAHHSCSAGFHCGFHARVTPWGVGLSGSTVLPCQPLSLPGTAVGRTWRGNQLSLSPPLSPLPYEGARSRYNLRYAIVVAGAQAHHSARPRGVRGPAHEALRLTIQRSGQCCMFFICSAAVLDAGDRSGGLAQHGTL